MLSDTQRAELRKTIAASRSIVETHDQPWRAAIDKRARPEADAPACTVLDFAHRKLAQHHHSWGSGGWSVAGLKPSALIPNTPFPLTLADSDSAVPEHSAEGNHRLKKLDWVAQKLGPDQPTKAREFEYLSRTAKVKELYTHEVYFERTAGKAAKEVRSDGALRRFDGGLSLGRAWVYSHKKKRIVCAGEVMATSSESVDLRSSDLNIDLFVNLVRKLPGSLRQVTVRR